MDERKKILRNFTWKKFFIFLIVAGVIFLIIDLFNGKADFSAYSYYLLLLVKSVLSAFFVSMFTEKAK